MRRKAEPGCGGGSFFRARDRFHCERDAVGGVGPRGATPIPTGIATDPILQPPFENGKPIDVKIGLHIVNIAAIDEVNEQFQMDAYLFARWIDQRLAYTPRGT